MTESTEPPNSTEPLRHNRDFVLLWSGEAVSSLGTAMSVLIFPLIGYAITHSTVQAGLATAAVLVGNGVFRLPAGALVDRWSRRGVLLWANVFAAACFGSLAIATLAGVLTLAQLVITGFFSGISEAFIAPATSASVRTVVPREQLPIAYTRLQVPDHTAALVGPPIGGALFSVARGLPFVVDAVSYLARAVSTLALRSPLAAPQVERKSLRAELVAGLAFVWRHSVIRATMLWGGAFNFSVTFVFVTITLRLVRAHVHPAAIGSVDTIGAVAGIAGAMVAPMIIRRVRTSVLTFASGLFVALVIVPMAWTTNVVYIGMLSAASVFLMPANNSGISAFMVSETPDHLQARVNSAGGFIANSLQPLAPVAAGALLGAFGGMTTTLVGAALVASSLLPLLASPAVRRLGRPDQWAAEPATT